MGQYLPVLAMAVLAVLFAGVSRLVSGLLAPRRDNPAKSAPYECGIIPTREPPERFPVRFYLVAMIFIVFDIETVFFLPWAFVHRDAGTFGLVAFLLFAVVLFETFVYMVAKGALAWGPATRRMKAAVTVPTRKPGMTVRLVGPEGSVRRPVDTAASTSEGKQPMTRESPEAA